MQGMLTHVSRLDTLHNLIYKLRYLHTGGVMQRQHRNNVPQLDLHGKTADEAESEIDRFVNE